MARYLLKLGPELTWLAEHRGSGGSQSVTVFRVLWSALSKVGNKLGQHTDGFQEEIKRNTEHSKQRKFG